MSNLVEAFAKPDRIWTRAEVLASTSPVPAKGGVYGWWFRKLPAVIDTSGCVKRDGLTLLYVGISPQPPPLNGEAEDAYRGRTDIEVVLLGSDSLETLKQTHGHYFESASEPDLPVLTWR